MLCDGHYFKIYQQLRRQKHRVKIWLTRMSQYTIYALDNVINDMYHNIKIKTNLKQTLLSVIFLCSYSRIHLFSALVQSEFCSHTMENCLLIYPGRHSYVKGVPMGNTDSLVWVIRLAYGNHDGALHWPGERDQSNITLSGGTFIPPFLSLQYTL